MSHARFVHLRVHSAYSLSEGAIKIDELVALCEKHNMPAVALTDTGNLFGALEFSLAAAKAGLQPIIGCQLAVAEPDGSSKANGQGNGHRQNGRPTTPDQLVLLVQNEIGYRNLLHLVSRSFLESPDGTEPSVTLAELKGKSDGLIALTAGVAGRVGRLLAMNKRQVAEDALLELAEIFPGRLYVELARHGLETQSDIEEPLIELAYRHDLPLVATNEAFFAEEGLYEAHDALLCIAAGTYVATAERRRLTPEHRFKSAEEMCALFADLPEAIDNTLTIARRCSFYPEVVKPILPDYPTAEGRNVLEELCAQASAGLTRRLEKEVVPAGASTEEEERLAKPYWERLDYELGVIADMGFPGYFLIVADFIQWAKQQGIPVGPGRGSGAGSLVAWSLTITGLDPLRWGLTFERFLNPERISMPDFDIDFCMDRRDEVIRYVQEKYGYDRVAQIITFGKLQARAALRDVGRVLQMPYGQVDRICKLVPNNPAKPVTLRQAIDGEPALQEMRDNDETVARLMDIALKLEGLYRHASTHAAGVVIADRPLEDLIPLYRDPRSDMPVTQFNMKFVELAGLVKFDFLGLKTLTILATAAGLLADRGEQVDLEQIPLDDEKTFDMLSRADSVGVFQMEGSGMRDVLRRLKPDQFRDLIAVVALYRPGPMDNIPSYISRKHGEEPISYPHPSLESILRESYGVMVYQDQVLHIARKLAGYTLGAADILRKAMGKKIQSEMDAQRKIFVDGAAERDVDRGRASDIFDLIAKFAGYGFNKAHAAAYAMVAYQTAYLKANYPVEFLAASMTCDLGNTEKLSSFVQESQALGIPVLPPDINRSRARFSVDRSDASGQGAIAYALAAIKNVGEAAMGALVTERDKGGRYAGLGDFLNRIDPRLINKRLIEALAAAGALDSLNPNRRQTMQSAELLIRHATFAAKERESTQSSLFGDGFDSQSQSIELPNIEDWPSMERLNHEHEAIGFYLSAHPLDAYQEELSRHKIVSYAALCEARANGGGSQRLAGVVLGKQERSTREGNKFAFVQLSDTSGIYEVILFSEVLSASRDLLASGQPLLLTVESRQDGEGVRLSAQRIEPLEPTLNRSSMELTIFLQDPTPLQHLRELLKSQAKGQGKVRLVLRLDRGQEAEVALPGGYELSLPVRQAIKAISGVVMQAH